MRQPPENSRTALRVLRGGEAEAIQQLRGAAVGGVPALVIVLAVQRREPHTVPGVLRGANVALDRAQLGVAVEHVLDRRLIHGRRLLRHVPEDPFRRHVDIAGVRVQLATQQREEARFAGAVCAGDADLLAREIPRNSRQRTRPAHRGAM